MSERLWPVVALAVLTAVLAVGTVIATGLWVSLVEGLTGGISFESQSDPAYVAYLQSIVILETLRVTTPGVAIAAALALVTLIAVLAVRRHRRDASAPGAGTGQAEAAPAS